MIINFITQFCRKLTGSEWRKRFEILLPLSDNEGRPFEAREFDQTAKEIQERFGSLTLDHVNIEGAWTYLGNQFRDDLIRLRIDTQNGKAKAFLKKQKLIWKKRFRQIDIWIIAFDIEALGANQYQHFQF